jgi:hypothetical protein
LPTVPEGGAILAWHEVPGKAPSKEPSRRVRYEGAQLIPEVFLGAMNWACEIPSHRTLRDGLLGVALIPGTSCQATIAPSLRDFRHRLYLGCR